MAGGAGGSGAGGEAGIPSFAALAARAAPPLDELALSMAVALRGAGAEAVRGALEWLDALGAEVAAEVGDGADPATEARACGEVLGGRHGFAGDAEHYDDPANSMLDLVLERPRGLPIALSVVYVEVARRAGVALAGVGLPGHYVVGHFGASPPLLLDPFAGGGPGGGGAPARAGGRGGAGRGRAAVRGGAAGGRARDGAADAQQPRRRLPAPRRRRRGDRRGRDA